MAKVANVRLLELEPFGSERILIRIAAEAPADIQAALDTAEETAARLGSTVTTALLANSDEAIPSLNAGPLTTNKLYGVGNGPAEMFRAIAGADGGRRGRGGPIGRWRGSRA